MLYFCLFQNQKRYGSGNWSKDLFLDNLQRCIDKNQEDLTVLILESVKTMHPVSERSNDLTARLSNKIHIKYTFRLLIIKCTQMDN